VAVKDYYDKACEAANKGNYDYAIELFREVLRREPEYPGARVLLRGTERRRQNERGQGTAAAIVGLVKGLVPHAKAHASRKDPLKQIEHCEDFLLENPRRVNVLLLLGRACQAAKLIESAVNTYKDVLSLAPENKRALRALAALQEEAGNLEDAFRAYTMLSRLEPRNHELAHKLRNVEAARHMKSSGMEGAKDFRDWLRDKKEAERSERRISGTEALQKGQLAEAINAVAEDNMNPTKITHLARVCQYEGDLESALRVLNEARERLPDNYQIREYWGDVRLDAFEKQRREIVRTLKKDPGDEALRHKAEQLQTERLELAVREYTWRVQQHPTDHSLRLKLAKVLYELKRYDEAIAGFQIASRDSKLEAEAAKMLGLSFGAKGQYDLAIEQLRRAIEKNPQMDESGIELQYLLAEALENHGDKEEALKIYKRIYSHDITFRDVVAKVAALSQ